jgi:hypothetical protein
LRLVPAVVALVLALGGCGGKPSLASLPASDDAAVDGDHPGDASPTSSCTPALLADGQDFTMAMAVTSTHLYWVNNSNGDNNGSVHRVALVAPVDQTLVPGAFGPNSLVVDDAHVFWTSGPDGHIHRMALDGSDLIRYEVTGPAVQLALDSTTVYYTTGPNTGVSTMTTDGVEVGSIAFGFKYPDAIVADADYVYFSDKSDGSLRKASKAGDNVTTLLPPRTWRVNGLAQNGSTIFLGTSIGVYAVPKTGGTATAMSAVHLVTSVAVDSTRVYFNEQLFGSILMVPFDQPGVETVVVSGLDTPLTVAVDDRCVYWASGPTHSASIQRAPK